MTRSKGSKNKKEIVRKKCFDCGSNKAISGYYKSNNPNHEHGVMNLCKKCSTPENIEDLEEVRRKLYGLDRPFINEIWLKSLEEIESRGFSKQSVFGIYLKNLQLDNGKYKFSSWKDTEEVDLLGETDKEEANPQHHEEGIDVEPKKEVVLTSQDKKNEEDVLRMLGYDPFELEEKSDKRHLYNKLVDFLDESTLEDSFKLPAVIEIVKTFNQIDKINSALSHITSNSKKVSENATGIKSLIDSKEKMLKSVLALAKDNGISVNHNNNKSKGAGTLSGIIKQLHEKGIDEVDINVYDIETSAGMKQVADISNRSILEQLMLNENDYNDMLKDQREMIMKLQSEVDRLEEENRKLRVKVKFLEINEKKQVQVIDVEAE